MRKIAAFTIVIVITLLASLTLSMIPLPAAAQSGPQSTPPAKLDFGSGRFPSSPQISQPQSDPTINLPEGRAMVIVQLSSPPLGTVFQETLQNTRSLSDALAAVRSERKTLDSLRQSLIARLTVPPFNARLVSATSIATNTLLIEVDTNMIEQISALPGVLSVSIDRIGQLDPGAQQPQPPGMRPGFGPVLDQTNKVR